MVAATPLLVSAWGVSQFVVTHTVELPAGRDGTWKLICPGNTAKIGARTAATQLMPKPTQTPARVVGIFPSTRSCAPACRAVPSGANFAPKIVAIAFGASA